MLEIHHLYLTCIRFFFLCKYNARGIGACSWIGCWVPQGFSRDWGWGVEGKREREREEASKGGQAALNIKMTDAPV